MKRHVFRALAVALALMLGCAPALSEVRATANVWLREGPGLGYDQVTSFSEGKRLDYLGETSVDERGVAWYKVTDGKHTGWVSSKYSELVGEQGQVVSVTPEPAPEATPEPAPEATPGPTAALPSLSELFGGAILGDEGGEARADTVELSVYYLEDLETAAAKIGLEGYRQVQSEAPNQYYDASVIIAGDQMVESMVIFGAGYELFGARVGMSLNEAAACLTAAGLDYMDAGEGAVYGHRGSFVSLFTDADGHDSCVNLRADGKGIITMIDWASYTG